MGFRPPSPSKEEPDNESADGDACNDAADSETGGCAVAQTVSTRRVAAGFVDKRIGCGCRRRCRCRGRAR